MTQNREPPAFQEYAAQMMARTDYRVMSLQARGLLYTLRLECWVNGAMPSDPALLARVLGFTHEEVAGVLMEVRPFFEEHGEQLRCPELDDYRAHLNQRRERQSQGGRAGAKTTNAGRSQPQKSATPSATPSGKSRPGRGSLVQLSSVQPSPDQPNTAMNEGQSDDDWARDYERASRGY